MFISIIIITTKAIDHIQSVIRSYNKMHKESSPCFFLGY
jgi:hypothetical protein